MPTTPTQRLQTACFLLLVACSPIAAPSLCAQTEDQQAVEQLENLFRDNETANETDAQLLVEQLEKLRDQPLDLNRCTPADLEDTRLLNELQLANFLTYRAEFGPFLNAYELQAIPGWDLDDIQRVLQYAEIPTGLDTRNTAIAQGFSEGQNELLMRWGHPRPPVYGNQAVEGKPNSWALRYRHQFDNRLRFGFTAENDPGEAFFSGSNRRGFDFYSAHLFGQNVSPRLRAIALGDYTVRLGQGLLLQTGFSPGKSAETTQVTRGGNKLRPYAAFGESFFFRGAAATFALSKRIELTALYSNRFRDGNVQLPDTIGQEDAEIAFTALQTSGLHRTTSEVEDERALREQAAGFSASYSGANGNISLNGLTLHYNKPWEPAYAAYRRYAFRGQTLTALSADYNWRYRNWLFFGETARSDNGAVAAVNGLMISTDRHVTLTAVHRKLSPRYQSVYANPFAEVTGASNEEGLYLGADIRLVRRWQINFYSDVWRHPWLRFGVNGPSQGHDHLVRVHWMKNRVFSAYVLWQSETKERDGPLETSGLVPNRRDRLRFHAVSKLGPGAELRGRVEWTTFREARQSRSYGFLAYQEVLLKPLGSPISATFRYALYDTDNFDSRVFAYENDLFSAVSIPAFSGRGARYYCNIKWRVTRWLRLEGRFEQTIQRRAVTSSGVTGRESFWKLQARIKW